MNKIVESTHFPQTNTQLIEQYENLRAVALDTQTFSSARPSGFSILSFRGMACWIKTLCSESVQINFDQSLQQINQQSLENMVLPSVHKEAIAILTNIVMLHQNELRRNHA
jgi:hypothetical protein